MIYNVSEGTTITAVHAQVKHVEFLEVFASYMRNLTFLSTFFPYDYKHSQDTAGECFFRNYLGQKGHALVVF